MVMEEEDILKELTEFLKILIILLVIYRLPSSIKIGFFLLKIDGESLRNIQERD
jgi:hypothetical protein